MAAQEKSPMSRKYTLGEGAIQVLFGQLPIPNSQLFSEVSHLIMQPAQASGANMRCRAMLQSFMSYIDYHEFPDNIPPRTHLNNLLTDFENCLKEVRPLNFGMGAAIQFLKYCFSRIPPNAAKEAAERWAKEQILGFIQDKIELPVSIIADKGSDIVADHDNILIYSRSQAVLATLLKAKSLGKQFRVTIVDSRPQMEGQRALEVLSKEQIPCTYVLISSLSYHMPQVTRVFLGCSGITNNGYLQNRVGTSMICCVAHSFKKPVHVFAETYKFSEAVQIDVTFNNELGSPDHLTDVKMYPGDKKTPSCLGEWRQIENLHILNLKYDLTPPQYIDMLVTEAGFIPVTSVPVIIRETIKDMESLDVTALE